MPRILPLPVDTAFDEATVDTLAAGGYAIVDGWLGDAGAVALRGDVVALLDQGCFAPSRVGSGDTRREANGVRRNSVCWFDGDARADGRDGRTGVRPGMEVALFLARISLLRQHLNRTCFLALTDVECHATCYEKSDFYGAHVDNAAGGSRRVISFVHYLSARAAQDKGGCLRMHAADGPPVDIDPLFDRLVVFQSRGTLHEVMPVSARRLSMTGWMSGNRGANVDLVRA